VADNLLYAVGGSVFYKLYNAIAVLNYADDL